MSESPTEKVIDKKLAKEVEKLNETQFDLVDPSEAPEPLKDLVMLGYQIMRETKRYAADYSGDRLSCSNCHFAAGNTTGGKGGGISLAGVAAKYPAFDERLKTVIDLPARINNCFTRSMNGKELPLDSKEMLALVTYLHYISKNFPIYMKAPWLDLKEIKSDHQPDAENGKKYYKVYCALCHHLDGEGRAEVPPLWGDHAFNNEAGMNQLKTLAAFIHENMPYEEPTLSDDKALDVAAYIIAQPHPAYKKN